MSAGDNGQVWLIRDSTNLIRGPYTQSEVLRMLRKGQLKGKTEVSHANSYWFALDEKIEVAKFFPELGLKSPEQSTQMTATLTQADVSDQILEATQVIPAPKTPEPAAEEQGIQWLSDEFADEFGEGSENGPAEDGEKNQEISAQDLLARSSVKADTLPSELKGFKGEKPRPIDVRWKNKQKSPSSSMVQVPVEKSEGQAKILPEEPIQASGQGKKPLVVALALLVLALAAVGIWSLRKDGSRVTVVEQTAQRRKFGSPEEALRRSFLLFDLEEAKAALADFELSPDAKGKIALPISQALLKKEFLYDTDGALMALQAAITLATDKTAEAEVENLMAIYRFDREPREAIKQLRRALAAAPGETVFQYNLALAEMRAGNPKEALTLASRPSGQQESLVEDSSLLAAWARDAQSKGSDPAVETAYLKALEAGPLSPKARLGLAIYRFRKGGMRASEADFRAFIESVPELDPPSEVVNYRQMSNFEFYNFARAQLRDLNVPLGAAGAKPSALVMAVDAMLSCLQNRTGEAGKILEVALTASPGDPSILKAMGYHRFKEGRYAEVIDLLKDQTGERGGFAVHLLLGKSYGKTGRRDEARKSFEWITAAEPSRAEGWALLGDLLLHRGRGDEARKSLKNALQRNPANLLALRGLDRLGDPVPLPLELAHNLPF